MKITTWVNLVLCFLTLTCCSTEEPNPEEKDFPAGYFPLEVGYYSIFDIEKINYSAVGPPDTINFHLKQLIADTFPNQNDGSTYRLKRFRRNDEEEDWQIDSVWTARLSNQRLIINENNVPYIKLAGLLKAGKQWDGNALNHKAENFYTIKSTKNILEKEFLALKDPLFENTLGVLQHQSKDTLINRVKAFEIYKKNIGLVYKESVNLHYCADESCFGQGIIESGTKLKQILIKNGNINE